MRSEGISSNHLLIDSQCSRSRYSPGGVLPIGKVCTSNQVISKGFPSCRSTPSKIPRRRPNLLEVEGGGASVLLLAGGAGLLELELAGGDGVLAALVGAGGDGLGDGQDEAAVGLGDGEGARGLRAGAVGDLGQGAVGDDLSAALDGGGLAVASLDHTELVAAESCVSIEAGVKWRGMAGRCNLHALSAVGYARGAEVGDLEDSLSASHGGGSDGKDGGGELHLEGWGLRGWWKEVVV